MTLVIKKAPLAGLLHFSVAATSVLVSTFINCDMVGT
jgi:hypothetical protein